MEITIHQIYNEEGFMMRIIPAILSIMLVLTLVSCGNKDTTISSRKKLMDSHITTSKNSSVAIKKPNEYNADSNDYISSSVSLQLSSFNEALEMMAKLESGEIPSEDEMIKLLDILQNPQQIEGIAHNAIYTKPDVSILDSVIFLCTNAANRANDQNTVNSFLHMAGAACERKAKLSDPETKELYNNYAIEFYKQVINRVDSGIATEEAANTAFFLASMLKDRKEYDEADTYYQKFAEYSEKIDHNPANAEFARLELANMYVYKDSSRAYEICDSIIKNNPDTRHLKTVTFTMKCAKIHLDHPDLNVREVFEMAQSDKDA